MKSYNFIALIFFLGIAGGLWAQAPAKGDSLLRVLQANPPDSIRIDTYIQLSISLRGIDASKEMAYIKKAIDLSENINDKKRISQSYLKLARYYDQKGMLPQAQKALSKVEEQFEHFNDTRIEATFYMLRGIIHYFEGTYNKAVADMFKAIPRYEALGDSTTIASCYVNIGVNYKELGNLNKALEYYRKALEIYDEMGYEKGIAMATGNIGEIFKTKKDYDQALDYYNRSLHVNQKYGYRKEAIIDLNNIGALYLDKGDYENALEYNSKSLNAAELLESQWDILFSKFNIAGVEFKMGHHKNAIGSFKKIIEESKALNYKEFIKDAHEAISEVYLEMGALRLAMNHRKKYEIWKDSLLNENHLNEIGELEVKYETEKKDQQITFLAQGKKLQEREAQRQATLKNVFVAGLILVLALAALSFHAFRQRLRNQKIIASKNEEIKDMNFKRQLSELEMKALQAQINPHFIFNCMNSINQMIKNKNNENASKYLTKFSKLIRLILENAEDAEVSLKDELTTLKSYIELESLRFKENINFEIEVMNDIDLVNTYLPSMVLQPFVENAIWHGLRHKKEVANGKIYISITEEQDQLVCLIQDNGVGRQRAFELQQKSVLKRKSLGLKITEDRLRLLSKELKKQLISITDLTDQTGKALGTRVEVNIPIS